MECVLEVEDGVAGAGAPVEQQRAEALQGLQLEGRRFRVAGGTEGGLEIGPGLRVPP